MIAPRRNCCLPLNEVARRRAFILTYPQVVRSYPQVCPLFWILPVFRRPGSEACLRLPTSETKRRRLQARIGAPRSAEIIDKPLVLPIQ